MTSLYKYCTLNTLLIFLFIGCSSSDKTLQPEVTPEINTETSRTVENSDNTPDKEINVVINDRVKYTFTKRDTTWEGTATQFDTNDPNTQKVVQVFDLDPVYGWSDFEDMLEFLNIYTMPDQSEIKNHKVGDITSQSRVYAITVFNGENTRSYMYFNPEGETADHWQSQKIATFGTYLATEMKVVN